MVVIVGDDESGARAFGDFADARGPGSQLFRGIKVVVTLVSGNGSIVREPSVVAAAVEADITNRRGGFGGGFDGFANHRLVDVAEASVVFAEESEGFRSLPGSVAKFDDERVIGKAFEHSGEIGGGLARTVEGKRELQEDGAEFIGGAKNVEPLADGAFVFSSSVGRGRFGIVGEFLPELRSEDKPGIGGNAIEPLCGMVRAQRLVEGSVDLDGVEEFGKKRCFVEIFGAARRVNVAEPVGIRPAGRTDAKD